MRITNERRALEHSSQLEHCKEHFKKAVHIGVLLTYTLHLSQQKNAYTYLFVLIAGRNQGGHFKRALRKEDKERDFFLFNIYTAKNAFLNCLHAARIFEIFFPHL